MKTIIVLFIATFARFATFAQKSKANLPASTTGTTILAKYACLMHSAVVSDKEGKCPICKMDLSLSKKEQMKADVAKLYRCPSRAEVVSNSPGTCAKCSSKLAVDRRGSKQGTTVILVLCTPMKRAISQASVRNVVWLWNQKQKSNSFKINYFIKQVAV